MTAVIGVETDVNKVEAVAKGIIGHLIFNEYNYVYLIALKNKDSVDFL